MNHSSFRAAMALSLSLFSAGWAFAGGYSLDRMTLSRPDIGGYVDDFSDGIAPPVGGPTPNLPPGSPIASYFLTEGSSFAAGDEAGGFLSFQRSGSAELCAGIFNCFLSKQVLLGTQVSATGTLGLRKAGEFSVTTTWALVNPEVGDQYRMGLFDGFPGNTANDNAQIFVFHGATGPRLLLRTLDPSLGTIQNIATVDLSGTLAERVVFIFDHAANSSFVQGSYQLLSGLNVIGSGVLGQAELFRGEEVTRLSFGAAFAAPPIPEPAALALLLLGLPLIGVVARRRNLAQRSFRSA